MATNSSLPDPAESSANTGQIGTPLTRSPGVARIIKVDDSTGCTLTNASIKGLTPLEFEALSNKEIDLARVIANSAEAQMLGVQEKGLTSLLNSSITNIKPLINKVNVAEQSMILPYIQRRQRSVMNANYFTVSANEQATSSSAADAAYEVIDTDVGDRVLTVDLGASDWASGSITNIERYFLPGGFLIFNGWDSSNNAVEVQFKILGSENVTGAISMAKVTVRPVGADITQSTIANGKESSGYKGKTDPNDWGNFTGKADYELGVGVLQTIANNVNDFEEWCRNQPTDLSVKLVVNWLQTTRESRQVDQSYKETLAKIMAGNVNPYAKSMVYQPIAEQNKIAAKASQDQWTRAIWYNQAISENQNPEKYMNLPAVTDPEDNSCTLEYKANALGIKALLREASRIKDNGGNALKLDHLMADIYYLKRNREQDGSSISVIDCMTDRFTYNKFYEKMAEYYETKYGISVQRNMQLNQTIKHDGIILFNYSVYDLPEVGCQLAVFHDPYFDDLLNVGGQFFPGGGQTDGGKLWNIDGTRSGTDVMGDSSGQAAFQKSARALWFIDWSDIKIGIAGTNSITRKQPHPETDRLYKCRMAHKETEYSLRSTKWTTMMDVPARHLVVENFDLDLDIT